MKTLVVFYSLSRGNTKRIAEMAAEYLHADLDEIETVTPYSGSYEAIVDQGQSEVESGFMPEIRPLKHDLSDYERILIGTPTWWYTMAPAVLTFCKTENFRGKIVVPFQTHGGWKGHALKDIEENCVGAIVRNGMDIRFDSSGGEKMITPVGEVRRWLEKL